MRIVEPSHEILFLPSGQEVLRHLELAGRTCYKSEDLIDSDSAGGFVARIIKSGHHSVIEHQSLSVLFICDRGVSHELVRHRLAAYSQESTRYANYGRDKFGKQITVVRPPFWEEGSEQYETWRRALEQAERAYLELLAAGARPEQARAVLPNSLKTEIVMTANLREWRHVFALRCSQAAHPQIRQLLLPLLAELHQRLPVVFDDLYQQYRGKIEKLPARP